MSFPSTRMRRLRRNETLRSLVRETRLSPESLIYPLFVCPGERVRKPVASMPGVFNLSVDELLSEARTALSLGVSSVILFGLPPEKDEEASGAWKEDGIVQQAIRALKSEHPRLLVIADVCLCEYMSHGHCGVVRSVKRQSGKASLRLSPPSKRAHRVVVVNSRKALAELMDRDLESHDLESPERRQALESPTADEFEIENDATLEILAKTSVSLAGAGADIIAPSDMMDGRVAAIRKSLDGAQHHNTPILSYAAKFASGFYGPFREAAGSAPHFGDRRSYQMDGANLREAMREIELDLEEGADMIMIKPAMPYLDVIAAARKRFDAPLAAYQVSGEYAMIQAAARNGWIEGERVMMESLVSIKRAGADMILTYFAKEAAKLLT